MTLSCYNRGCGGAEPLSSLASINCKPNYKMIKSVIESISAQRHSGNTVEKPLSRRLASYKTRVRQQATQEILDKGVRGRDLLIEIMRRAERQRKTRRHELYGRISASAVFFAVLGLMLHFERTTWTSASLLIGILIGIVVSGPIIGIFRASIVTRAHTNAAYLLAKHYDDVSIIGPLTEALEYRSKAVRREAASTLIRLLPRLQSADADLLNSQQVVILNRALMGKNPELVLAIVRALEHVGDSRAISGVEGLASGNGIANADERMQAVAGQTLLVLQERAETERVRSTLLRASASSEAGADILLRPSAELADTQKQQLLRASNSADE